MILTFLTKYRELGLLLLRVGLGVMFVIHGAPKIMGGPETWTALGKATSSVGIHFLPIFWGFMAACAECFGGLFLILGLFFRPACILLGITMTVAAMMHLSMLKPGTNFMSVVAHPIEMAIVFYSLILIGPGKYSVDKS